MNQKQENFDAGAGIYKKAQDNLNQTPAYNDFRAAFSAAGSDVDKQNDALQTFQGTDSYKQYQKATNNYGNFKAANNLLYPSQTPPVEGVTPNLSEAAEAYNPTTTDANLTTATYLNQGNTNVTGTDLETGIYGATRPATQLDVDSGLATAVGQQIGNTVSLPQAEEDMLNEVQSDAGDAANIKLGAVEDKYSNLVGAVNDMTADGIAVLDEDLENATEAANTLVDASDTKLENIEGASGLLTPLEQAASTESVTDAETAMNTMQDASKDEFDQTELASANLAQAEYDANRAQYQNITDALRADRLGAMRRGESTTTGTGDRMRLEAEMRAARDFAGLDNASKVAQAGRTLDNTMALGAAETESTGMLAKAQLQDNQTDALVREAQRTLQNVSASAEEKAEAQKLISDTQYAGNKAKIQLQAKQDIFVNLMARENERLDIANELANVVQSTQEQTLPAVKLAELLIEQAIDEGNLEVKTAEEKYQAKIEKAKELLASPSLMAEMATQLEGEQLQLSQEFDADQQLFLNRINNLKNIPGMVQTIIDSVGEDMFAAYEASYGELGAIWAAGVESGHVDANGLKTIPTNQFGETNVGNASTTAAGAEAANIPGDSEKSPITVGLEDGKLNINLGVGDD